MCATALLMLLPHPGSLPRGGIFQENQRQIVLYSWGNREPLASLCWPGKMAAGSLFPNRAKHSHQAPTPLE